MGNLCTKPPAGTGIDWTNPLARGLVVAFALNEGSGPPWDAAMGLSLRSSPGPLPTWGSGPQGAALITDGTANTADGYYALTPDYAKVQNATLVWSGKINSSLVDFDTYAPIWGTTYASNDSAPYYGVLLTLQSGGLCLGTRGSTGIITLPRFTFTPGTRIWLAGTQDSTAGVQRFYADDPWAPTATGSDASLPIYSDSWLTLGAYGSTRNPHATHDYAFMWNRVLSSVELASVKANPWQLFLYQSPSAWYLTEYVPVVTVSPPNRMHLIDPPFAPYQYAE